MWKGHVVDMILRKNHLNHCASQPLILWAFGCVCTRQVPLKQERIFSKFYFLSCTSKLTVSGSILSLLFSTNNENMIADKRWKHDFLGSRNGVSLGGICIMPWKRKPVFLLRPPFHNWIGRKCRSLPWKSRTKPLWRCTNATFKFLQFLNLFFSRYSLPRFLELFTSWTSIIGHYNSD